MKRLCFLFTILFLLCALGVTYGERKPLKATPGAVDEEFPAPDGYYVYYSIKAMDIDIGNPDTYNLRLEEAPDEFGNLHKMITLCDKDAKFVVTSFKETSTGRKESLPGTLLPDESGETDEMTQENEYFEGCAPRRPIEVHFEVPPPVPGKKRLTN